MSAPDKTGARISGMFDAIAPRYDLLNRLLSAGIDRRWRAAAIRSLNFTGRETLLDVCTGTADVALEARRGGAARVLGVDFAGAMLKLGLVKVRAAGEDGRIPLVRGDAMSLPARSSSVDAVTVAFGIRNVEHTEQACAEMARVLKPGGRLAILEFGVPKIPGVSALYLWYFRSVLPLIGRLISGHSGAYTYLPASVGAFPPPERFMAMLQQVGFVETHARAMTFGIVHLYTATRQPQSTQGAR
jgi:demethylmenaquinone methyltransferase / 2-methoxy-6-polyprenyl-1,4-benzoquinol methylase